MLTNRDINTAFIQHTMTEICDVFTKILSHPTKIQQFKALDGISKDFSDNLASLYFLSKISNGSLTLGKTQYLLKHFNINFKIANDDGENLIDIAINQFLEEQNLHYKEIIKYLLVKFNEKNIALHEPEKFFFDSIDSEFKNFIKEELSKKENTSDIKSYRKERVLIQDIISIINDTVGVRLSGVEKFKEESLMKIIDIFGLELTNRMASVDLLHLFEYHGPVDMLKLEGWFKLFNIDLDVVNEEGKSLLHVLIESECYHPNDKIMKELNVAFLIQKFKQYGKSLDEQDEYGDTALHTAIFNNTKEIVKILLIEGADSTIANKKGDTAHFLIDRNKWIDILKGFGNYTEVQNLLTIEQYYKSYLNSKSSLESSSDSDFGDRSPLIAESPNIKDIKRVKFGQEDTKTLTEKMEEITNKTSTTFSISPEIYNEDLEALGETSGNN